MRTERPSVAFAMRYPDDIGLVWNAMACLYDRSATYVRESVSGLLAFPELTNRPAFAATLLDRIRLDCYNTTPEGKRSLAAAFDRYRIRTLVYMGCDPRTVDVPWIHRQGVETICYEGDSYPAVTHQPFLKYSLKYVYKRILRRQLHSTYVANAQHQRRFLLDVAVLPPDQVTTIVNGVDVEYLSPGPPPDPAALGLPRTDHYAITICQARPEKRVDFLIDVAAAVFAQAPCLSLTFVHVGPGESLPKWQQRARQRGLGDRFVFAGAHHDVRPFLRLASVLVHAAERESFGLVLAEAMACGKPTIVVGAPGPREIVADGHTGLIVDSYDVDTFASELLTLLSSPDRIRQWGATARLRAVEHFSLERQARALSELIAAWATRSTT